VGAVGGSERLAARELMQGWGGGMLEDQAEGDPLRGRIAMKSRRSEGTMEN